MKQAPLPTREEIEDDTDIAIGLLLTHGDLVALRAMDSEGEDTIGLFVNCSDVFAWGCADCEPAPLVGWGEDEDFWRLYEMARTDWGSAKWVALKRKLRPQKPVEARIRKLGLWDDEWDSLPARRDRRAADREREDRR